MQKAFYSNDGAVLSLPWSDVCLFLVMAPTSTTAKHNKIVSIFFDRVTIVVYVV